MDDSVPNQEPVAQVAPPPAAVEAVDAVVAPEESKPAVIAAAAEPIADSPKPISKPEEPAAEEPTKEDAVKEEQVKEENTTADEPKAEAELPDDAVIITRLKALLAEVDLSVTSEKMLRKRLEEELKVDLTSKKNLLRSEIQAYLAEQQGDEEEGEEEEEEEEDGGSTKKRRRSGTHRFGDCLSEQMKAFLGMERCPRTQVVKKLWEYIKANELQDPKDKRRIILDDKLKTIFPNKSVTMFTMQKHLSRHVFIADEIVGGDASERSDDEEEEERPKKKKPAAKKPAAKKKKADDGSAPKVNGFTKPLKLSPEFAAWMGSETSSRPAITKHLWAYVKSNNLQDPSNKQFVLADETLKKLTGEDRFQAFGFSKLIKDHLLGYAD